MIIIYFFVVVGSKARMVWRGVAWRGVCIFQSCACVAYRLPVKGSSHVPRKLLLLL